MAHGAEPVKPAEARMEEAAAGMLREEPKLDGAMRNLLSLRLAQAQTAPARPAPAAAGAAAAGAGAAAAFPRGGATIGADGKLQKLSSQEVDDYFARRKGGDAPPMDATKRLKLAGVVLRAINAHALQDPLPWANETGQKEDQTASDRLDEIMRYKVAHLVAGKIQAQPNAKITKTLGASYLALAWPQIRLAVDTPAQALGSTLAEIEREFADFLPESLSAASASPDGAESSPVADASDDRELVWAADLAKVMARRHEARQAAALQRAADPESAGGGATIEEVNDDTLEK